MYIYYRALVAKWILIVEQYDYPAEEHNVTTEDGYNLKIHKITGSPLLNNNVKKKIVFLQHALLSSSDSWVVYGPKKDLGMYSLIACITYLLKG